MLLQILAAWPAPASPARMTFRAMGASVSRTASKSSAAQPTMKARVPASAPTVPPETGASAMRKPAAAASAATARADSTSMVEQSIRRAPAWALGKMSSR